MAGTRYGWARSALALSAVLAGCAGGTEPFEDAGSTELGPSCQTTSLPAARTLTATSGAELFSPRFDPSTGALFALSVVDLAPEDVVELDGEGRVLRRLGLRTDLRTVPTDFALARHAAWIIFSGRAGISRRTIAVGPVHVLLPGRLGIEPEISPDGRRLVFRENTRLYQVHLSDNGEVIGEPSEIVLTQSVGAMRPRFDPTGERLAYFMSGVVEIYEIETQTRRVLTPVIGQAHVAWLDEARLVIADDRGISILREDCVEARLEIGPARQVDASPSDGSIVFELLAEPGLRIIRGVRP